MADTTLSTEEETENRLYAAWRFAKAQWDSAEYSPETQPYGLSHDKSLTLCSATADALNAYLRHPASTLAALAQKLRVFRDEEIWDNWRCAEEITAALANDAQRLAFGD